jgi:outer membrane receptor for ferrienterochelin and colicin
MTEVVVVAYGTKKKTELTGSVATVKGADIENKPFTSVDKALQGNVAGLQSVAASGAPGANQQIRIRGISSITASNAPLWVIDGVPVLANDLSRQTTTANILSTLNPNDIERMQHLLLFMVTVLQTVLSLLLQKKAVQVKRNSGLMRSLDKVILLILIKIIVH